MSMSLEDILGKEYDSESDDNESDTDGESDKEIAAIEELESIVNGYDVEDEPAVMEYVTHLLSKTYTDYKETSPLPNDLLVLCVSFNAEIRCGNGGFEMYRSERYDGKRHGVTEYWYDNGTRQSLEFWAYGKREGMFTRWYANGQKQSETEWCNNQRHGVNKGWSYDGTLKYSEMYEHGIKRYINMG